MASVRSDLFWEIPATLSQEFFQEGKVGDVVPARWNLKPGDYIGYETSDGAIGLATVISVDKEVVDFIDDNEGDPIVVQGNRCVFRKIY